MARARNIKPSFFMNDSLVELSFECRLLFIGLWTLADREGKLEDRPKRIKMEIFPADNVDIEKALSELQQRGFIERYCANGINVLLVTNFLKHQRPHHTEKASELPNKDGSLTVISTLNNVKEKEQDGENPPDTGYLIPDSLIPDSLNDDSLNDEVKAQAPTKTKMNHSDLVSAGIEKQKAAEFLELRKAKKQPLTITAWKLLCSEAEKLGWKPSQAIEKCLSQSWGGFKAQWVLNEQNQARASPAMSKQEAIEAKNKAAGDEWLKREMEAMKNES